MAYVAIPPSSSTDLSGGAWGAAAKAFLQSKVATLSSFEYLHAGWYSLGSGGLAGLTANDALTPGGGKGNAVAGGAMGFGHTIVQAAKTGVFGIYGRAVMQAPTAAKVTRFGLCTTAATARIVIGTDNSVSAANYYRQVEGTTAATAVAHSAGYHNFAITGNATNIEFWVDGASAGSIAASVLTADEALHFFISGTDANAINLTQFVWGGIRS